MEVDQNNLMKALDLIKTKLEKCEFISLHLLSTNRIEDKLERCFFENHHKYYESCVQVLKNHPYDFQPLEIGLIIWRKDDDGDTTYQAFNFPIYPNQSTLIPIRKRSKFFTLDEKNINQLIDRDFKFNDWIKDSLSHLTIFESDLARAKLQENQNEMVDLNLEGDDKVFIEDMVRKMNDFLEQKDQTTFRFPACNGWKRRLIYQTFKSEPYSKSTFLQTCKIQKDVVIVNKLSEAEVQRRLDEYYNKQIGFLAVFKLLIHCQKPLIGFDIFNDLLIYYKTFWTSPPEALNEFKEIFRSLFPSIIDIRYMAREHFDNDSLENLFLKLDTKYKTLGIAQKVTSDSKAFKIGCTFLKLLNHYYKLDHPDDKFNLSKADSIMERFKNKLSLSNAYDLKSVDLSNDNEDVPERNDLRIVKILLEDRFLDVEEWIQKEGHKIITWFGDDDFVMKFGNDNISLNEDLVGVIQLFTVQQYFDEERRICREEADEEKKERIRILETIQNEEDNDDEENGLTDAVMDIMNESILSDANEIKLPRDDDEENETMNETSIREISDPSLSDEDNQQKKGVKRSKNSGNDSEQGDDQTELNKSSDNTEETKKKCKNDNDDSIFEENSDWSFKV